MSSSLYVVGIRPVDDKWKKMKAIWDACETAGIEVPEKVNEYFDWTEPNENGVVVDIRDCCKAKSDWNYLIDIS